MRISWRRLILRLIWRLRGTGASHRIQRYIYPILPAQTTPFSPKPGTEQSQAAASFATESPKEPSKPTKRFSYGMGPMVRNTHAKQLWITHRSRWRSLSESSCAAKGKAPHFWIVIARTRIILRWLVRMAMSHALMWQILIIRYAWQRLTRQNFVRSTLWSFILTRRQHHRMWELSVTRRSPTPSTIPTTCSLVLRDPTFHSTPLSSAFLLVWIPTKPAPTQTLYGTPPKRKKPVKALQIAPKVNWSSTHMMGGIKIWILSWLIMMSRVIGGRVTIVWRRICRICRIRWYIIRVVLMRLRRRLRTISGPDRPSPGTWPIVRILPMLTTHSIMPLVSRLTIKIFTLGWLPGSQSLSFASWTP